MSVDSEENGGAVRAMMEARGFDIAGVRRNGRLDHWVAVSKLANGGVVGDVAVPVAVEDCLEATVSIRDPFRALTDRTWVFVQQGSAVSGIVTRADLQKPAARLYVFGVLTVFEMHVTGLIRKHDADGWWHSSLSPKRLEKAKEHHEKRRKRREELDLVDCLQFCDKGVVVRKTAPIKDALGFADSSGTAIEAFFATAQKVRDRVAHGNDLAPDGEWSAVGGVVEKTAAAIECIIARGDVET